VISAEEAKTLEESGTLFDEFSNRNLQCCSNCGLKSKLLEVSEWILLTNKENQATAALVSILISFNLLRAISAQTGF
jgi:hypothetical protein